MFAFGSDVVPSYTLFTAVIEAVTGLAVMLAVVTAEPLASV
jgi:hypothetical protein